MSEPKFTPGPWVTDIHFQQRYGGRIYVPILRPGNDPVPIGAVHIEVDGYGRDEGMANAHLIAAAPDLYAALKHLGDVYEGIVAMISDGEMALVRAAWAEADAALAKADGTK